MRGSDLLHMASLAKINAPAEHLLAYFYHPGPCFPKDTVPDEATRLFETITRQLQSDPSAERFFMLHLAACFLLYRQTLPPWTRKWVMQHASPERLLPGWAQLVRGYWQSVPVLLTRRNTAAVRHIIIGAVSFQTHAPEILWPEWADGMMDDAAKKGFRSAIAAARAVHKRIKGRTLFLFPLVPPDPRTLITGGSLALPAALGFLAVLFRRPLPQGLAATGGILPGGKVAKIGGFENKVKMAQTGQTLFSGLIYPLSNGYRASENPPVLLPVSDLHQAWMFARLFLPEKAQTLALFSQMLKHPEIFVRNVAAMPPEWVNWTAKHRQAGPIIDRVLKTPVLFEALVHRFEQTVYKSEADISAALAGLIPFRKLQAVSGNTPLLAFKWYSAGLSMCNHFGKVFESDFWINAAENLFPLVQKAGVDDAAVYCNHCVVACHNRYEFHRAIPHRLRQMLLLLEEQYRIQGKAGCTTFPVLGRIYGTMVQHYAFCGPDCLPQTESFFRLACKTLGEGTVPEHEAEWRRQYNYLCYALLDAGPEYHDRARKALFAHLAVGGWSRIRKKLPVFTRWQHALLARFLADVPDESQRIMYLDFVASSNLRPEPYHPWQLWCFNMGRLASKLDKPHEAGKWFDESISICMSSFLGPSIQVMGLLGLSGIYHKKRAINPEHAEIYSAIRHTARQLNPDHFAVLDQKTDCRMLSDIWKNPAVLFPFNYH